MAPFFVLQESALIPHAHSANEAPAGMVGVRRRLCVLGGLLSLTRGACGEIARGVEHSGVAAALVAIQRGAEWRLTVGALGLEQAAHELQ